MKLITGIILIILSVIHVLYGEKKLLKELADLGADQTLTGSVRVMTVQGGALLFATGVIELLSYSKAIQLSGIAGYFPLGLVCINVISCILVIVFKHRELLKIVFPQLVIFLIIIVLMKLSI
ncbi:hypothetical protein LRR81_07920 [Metabacillus sp. GX 13764]|uniref:hypothetical protein n=1 Tax=Metabacillus kandeliae TaxID=2900151 RepID=UPI001E43011F|nr:hypothetical protein [Metabacillus kandeliae]MCD7034158.1 hypothetical protein [Metabacillus kandeliae]